MPNMRTYEVCIINGFKSASDYYLTDLKKEANCYSERIGLKHRVDNAAESSDFVEFKEQLEVGDYQKMKKRQEKKSNLIDMNKEPIRDGNVLIEAHSKDLEEIKSIVAKTQKINEPVNGLSLKSMETGNKPVGIFRWNCHELTSLKFTSSGTQFSHLSIINEGVQ